MGGWCECPVSRPQVWCVCVCVCVCVQGFMTVYVSVYVHVSVLMYQCVYRRSVGVCLSVSV